VRFNLSVDDGLVANQSPCSLQSGATYTGLRFHNNTIVGARLSWGLLGNVTSSLLDPAGLELRNNIFYATAPQTATLGCGAPCSHNLFFGLPPTGSAALSGDPLFRDATRRGRGRLAVGRGFRLRQRSPARGAGIPVPGSTARDYFGRPLPSRPAIGFSQH
jgi:hypothetical protein